MASNKIQIRRSQTNNVVTGLSPGELAFTQAGNILYVGAPDGSASIPIGGARNPGVLIANQALVANSTGGINRIVTSNVTLNALNANNDWGTPGYILTSAGTTGNAFWAPSSSFGVDPFAQYTWANTQTFQNTVTFSLTINGTANNSLRLGGELAASFVNVAYGTSTYQRIDTLSANVAKLNSNNASYLGTELATYFAANSALLNYQTTAGLSDNVATLTARNAYYLNGIVASQYAYANSVTPLQRNDTLAANVATLTANSSLYLGPNYYTYYAAASALASYQTTAGLAAKVATLPANSTNFVGTGLGFISAANVVSNSQLQANLANYVISGDFSAQVATLPANSATYFNGQLASYYATASSLSNYQTTAGLAAAVAVLPANNATYLNGQLASYYTTNSALTGYVLNLTSNSTNYIGSGVGFISAANVVSNAQLIANLANYAALSGALFTGSVNATSHTTGGPYGTTARGAVVNTTHIAIGNNSVNGAITSNATNVYFTGTSYTANNSAYLGGVYATSYATTSYVDAAVYNATGGAATQAYVDGKAATAYSNAQTLINNSLINIGTQITTAYSNAMADTLSKNRTYTGVQTFSSNTIFTGNVTSTNLYATNIAVSGNLTITGTLTTVDSNVLVVKDNMIKVADQQATTASYIDSLDFGIYGAYGNTANAWYSGIYRDHATTSSSGRKDVWKLFTTKLEPADPAGAAIVDSNDSTYNVGTLVSYLEPHGPSVGTGSGSLIVGGFLANSSKLILQSNSTFNVSITANNINLTSAMTPLNGGTGQTAFSTGDMLYAANSSSLSKLSVGQIGTVLQISASNLPYYDVLDGGSF